VGKGAEAADRGFTRKAAGADCANRLVTFTAGNAGKERGGLCFLIRRSRVTNWVVKKFGNEKPLWNVVVINSKKKLTETQILKAGSPVPLKARYL